MHPVIIRKWLKNIIFFSLFLCPLPLYASFIESTIGTAVVNDATATYYNPAGLTLLKNSQFITLGSVADFHTQFTGQLIQAQTGFTQSGSSRTQSRYFLPSLYLGIPTTNKFSVGLAIISNVFNRDLDDNSILRYSQSNNSIQDIDFVPAVGMKLNDFISVGAGLNFSYARFHLESTFGFPSLNIPDTQSRNQASGTSLGEDLGILFKPSQTTLVGLNYRSAMTYRLNGNSVFESNPQVISDNYHFTFWTPARTVLSISQAVTSALGLIGTIQRIQWSIFQNTHIQGIATRFGGRRLIVNATIPYHLHDSWLFTAGGQYRVLPKWVIRLAGSYIQSPGNGNYQLSTGDSYVLGASTAYEISKNWIIDGSYAHAFIKNENINITGRNIINGVNKADRDSISLKLTFNFC